MKTLAAGILLTLCCVPIVGAAQTQSINANDFAEEMSKPFYDGFEAQNDKLFRASHHSEDTPYIHEQIWTEFIKQSPAHARNGKYSMEITIPHVRGHFRTEVETAPLAMGAEYWYGFSIYLPKDWQVDSQGNILAQWHATPAPQARDAGDGKPPISIGVENRNWFLRLHWNTNGNGSAGSSYGEHKFDLGAIQPGTWVDYVVHVTWRADKDGRLQVWKDGKEVVRNNGPNVYSMNPVAPHMNIGIYHPELKPKHPNGFSSDTSVTRDIVVYDDEVRMRPAPANYDDVKPRGEHPF